MIKGIEENTDINKRTALKEHTVSSASSLAYFDRIPAVALIKNKLHDQKLRLNKIGTRLLGVIVICALVGFGAGWLGAGLHNNEGVVLNGTLSPQKEIVTSESQLITSIAQTVGPSVVSVNVTSTTQSLGANSGLLGLMGLPQTQQSAGTGIILTSAGLVVTNRHVIPQGTTSVSVTLSNGTQLNNVSVIGETSQNSSLDIAFLKINNAEGNTLIPAVLGNSSSVQVGEEVVAIGNALGQFQNTVTSGIISGYGRSVQASNANSTQGENLEDLFQTDAAINEGNSGGPLVNMNGQVIAINTAIASNAQNIGFAIPINDAKGLIQQVEATGKFQQPYLGVYYIPITSDIVQQYDLSANNGAWIPPANVLGQNPIIAGGPAANTGLKAGDIITQINGTVINQNNSLTSLINQYQVGQNVNLTVIRNGKTMHFNVTLAAEPAGVTSG